MRTYIYARAGGEVFEETFFLGITTWSALDKQNVKVIPHLSLLFIECGKINNRTRKPIAVVSSIITTNIIFCGRGQLYEVLNP